MSSTGQFTGKFYQTYKEEIIPMLFKVFPQTEGDKILPNSFQEATIHYYGMNQTKTLQNKRKLQANIFDKYRCKNPQQNIRKPNAKLYKKDHTP